MPLSPVTPFFMSSLYVGITPALAYFSMRSGRMPSDANMTTRAGGFSFLARAVPGPIAAVRTSSAKTAMPSPDRTFFIPCLPGQVGVGRSSFLELPRQADQDLGLLGRE